METIKEETNEHGTFVVHMDFAENHTLHVNKEIMQAHCTKQQATLSSSI